LLDPDLVATGCLDLKQADALSRGAGPDLEPEVSILILSGECRPEGGRGSDTFAHPHGAAVAASVVPEWSVRLRCLFVDLSKLGARR
jgi:hypothetical protein